MLPQIIVFLGMILSMGYLALRGIRAFEDSGRGSPDLGALAEEIRLLREEHERLHRQVAAIHEGAEFRRQLRQPRPAPRASGNA